MVLPRYPDLTSPDLDNRISLEVSRNVQEEYIRRCAYLQTGGWHFSFNSDDNYYIIIYLNTFQTSDDIYKKNDLKIKLDIFQFLLYK